MPFIYIIMTQVDTSVNDAGKRLNKFNPGKGISDNNLTKKYIHMKKF